MIETATTLVIGAGASVGYGLPVAASLKKSAQDLSPASDIYQLLLKAGFQLDELNDWLQDLRAHPSGTIDEFLETRKDYRQFVRIGKGIIAGLLGQVIAIQQRNRLDHAVTAPKNDDWLGEVVKALRTGVPTAREFARRNQGLKIITFNFDSIIEERLLRDIRQMYRTSSHEDLAAALAAVHVLHVHGRLPEVPPIAADGSLLSDMGDLAPGWKDWLLKSIDAVNIVFDSIPDEILAEARTAVAQAHTVCFLGFSYHPDNLVRLGIPETIKNDSFQAIGSAFDVPNGRRHVLHHKWFKRTIQLGGMEDNCLEVLWDFPVFSD